MRFKIDFRLRKNRFECVKMKKKKIHSKNNNYLSFLCFFNLHLARHEHWPIQLKLVSLRVSAGEKVTDSSHHTMETKIYLFIYPSKLQILFIIYDYYWFVFIVRKYLFVFVIVFLCATFLQHWWWICSYDGRWSKVSLMHHSTKEWKTSGCSLWNHQLLPKETSTMGRTSHWWGPLCSVKSNYRRTKKKQRNKQTTHNKTIEATIINCKYENKYKQKQN